MFECVRILVCIQVTALCPIGGICGTGNCEMTELKRRRDDSMLPPL